MTRHEFKSAIADFIDSLVPDGELSEESETTLNDHLGEVAGDILLNEDDDEEPVEVKES